MKRKTRLRIRKLRYITRNGVFNIYSRLKHPYWLWRIWNYSPIQKFSKNSQELSPLQQRIVDDLNNKGIATTSLEELFPGNNVLSSLQTYTESRESRARVNHKKKFLLDYFSEIPELGFENPFFGIAINDYIVTIVNSYMKMFSVLNYFTLRRTIVALEGATPEQSQKWHRTQQEKKVCSVFIYLNEVGKNSGPFTYIANSTYNKKWGHVLKQHSTKGAFINDEEMKKHISEKEYISIIGKPGTVIFCDTTGLRKGGFSIKDTRLMSTFGYTAPTYRENIHYSFTQKLVDALSSYSEQSQFLLNKKWKRRSH